MTLRVSSSAVKTNQWVPPKKSHVGVFDVTCISYAEKENFCLLSLANPSQFYIEDAVLMLLSSHAERF
ncbi:unnamed protein product [Larinioides sclopetarius]|uniref:Uncharacterized protein n=1 Tax=Larinioides sclopetarius TaxID=280406 RepID=A0AAV1YTQ3_9ARAC